MPPRRSILALFALFLFLLAGCEKRPTVETYARNISSLIDPAKLATLSERGANPRVQNYVAQLAEAKRAGLSPERVAGRAVALAGMKGESAAFTAGEMVGNLTFADLLGCLDDDGLRDMRRGQSPTIKRGPCKGEHLSVDQVIPLSVAPELGDVIAYLEVMPLRWNMEKRDKIGEKEIELGRNLKAAGLLSDAGLQAVLRQR